MSDDDKDGLLIDETVRDMVVKLQSKLDAGDACMAAVMILADVLTLTSSSEDDLAESDKEARDMLTTILEDSYKMFAEVDPILAGTAS